MITQLKNQKEWKKRQLFQEGNKMIKENFEIKETQDI